MGITYPPEMLPSPDPGEEADVVIMEPGIENRLFGMRDVLMARRSKLAETILSLRTQIAEIDRQLSDCASAARIFNLEWPEVKPYEWGSVKRLIRLHLEEAGEAGVTVKKLRPIIEQGLGRSFHPKTLGMKIGRAHV